MEVTKGEESSAEQAASLFGASELESQRRNTEGGKKRNNCKIITGVLLLCLLVVILAVVFSLRKSGDENEGKVWLQVADEEIQQPKCPSGFSKPPLILVSLDGFRAEYLKDHGNRLPVIKKLRNSGTTTEYMRPVYPTKTFPNHYSIVTGLYPESHGIVDNKMYDVTRNTYFSLKTDEKFNAKWYQGDDVLICSLITFLVHRSISFEKRVSTLFQWLSLPQGERPDFYTLYLDEPDTSGHMYGPASSQVVRALENVDRILGLLMNGLLQRDLQHCVNIIIISDHGMEEASSDRAAYVSNYVADTAHFSVIQGPAARIRPTHLPDNYFSCETSDQAMRPYLKENLPKRMHFANNKRIERGHLYMKEGWQAALKLSEFKYRTGGFHGSDNLFTNMQAIFIGYGPGFKHKTVVPPFENIEIYNLMCDLLGIRPAPNNGTHGSLNHLLNHPVHLPVHPAQLSHDTPCEASAPSPTDDQCNCTSQTKAMVCNRLLSDRLPFCTDVHHLRYEPDVSFCLLHHSNYLNGYSKDRLMPLWVSYTIQPLVSPLPESEACVRADVRIPSAASQLCLRYREDPALSYGLLHPPSEYSLITSNMAPMFPAFKDVWAHVHDVLLPKYSQQLNGVNVMSGPIFDGDYDGNVDALKAISGNETIVPTHFFMILTSCRNETFSPVNCKGPLQAKSFILPHRPDHTESCASGSDLTWVEDWLQFHVARVRDVELLSGLSFYHDRISVEETLQLKTLIQTA
uniref:Ectonucleotide pyrophosphatase/phosphodiesterase 1 n=1 Tax=Dicentrarchus labrax TaxID=13489 RepID=A0A8C4DYY3_DICLA